MLWSYSQQGSTGVDGVSVDELKAYLDVHRQELEELILDRKYIPQVIRSKEMPKKNGKVRILGIPTVVDRMLQQAVTRVLQPLYEVEFSTYSYGFCPLRNTHQAVIKSLDYINSGHQHIVDVDLKGFFDEVDHAILLQLLYRKVKCRATMCLIRRWLRAPIEIDGKLHKRRKGVPQGSPISPLLSNIILHELDCKLEAMGLKFVRYADDFSIYCKSQWKARKIGNQIYVFLRDQLKLPINREKSGIRRPVNFNLLGYGFVPTYRKGEKGKYQLVVAKSAWQELKKKIKKVTRKTKGRSFDERMEKLKSVQQGWLNYFKLGSIQRKLEKLDGWVRIGAQRKSRTP
ncbi:MAG: group II intron reverse transcriptase/maturase [Bacteroidales bacterium]|nr:group II intron reverse transcriptase/maturase [Bacteroidales bacterium]